MRANARDVCGLLLALTCGLGLATTSIAEETVRVTAPAGAVVGRVDDGVAKFLGIPYAEPPTAALRWKAPQARKPWHGDFDATRPGRACIQWAQKTGPVNGPVGDPYSEDCLILNITAPAVKPAKPMPVMVWIHGGGFIWGVGDFPYYGGESFVRNGVIVITFNYRMGTLGFFAYPSLTKAAALDEPLYNYGLMDTVAALKWVRANISAFGGDANNITIAGESAGSMAVNTLLTAESAQGLFHKAIMESGVATGRWIRDLQAAEEAGQKTIAEIGLEGMLTPEQLRLIPSFYLIPSSSRLGSAGPVIDGRFLKEDVVTAVSNGRAAKVPVLIGANDAEHFLPTPSDFEGFGPRKDVPPIPAGAREAFGIAKDDALRDAMAADRVPAMHALMAEKLAALGSPTYLYLFSYVPENLRSSWQGVPHFGEVGYVFDTARSVKGFYGESTQADVAMAQTVNRCWADFMKTGVPSCSGRAWPAYKEGGDVLVFGNDGISVRKNFRAKQWNWWRGQANVAE